MFCERQFTFFGFHMAFRAIESVFTKRSGDLMGTQGEVAGQNSAIWRIRRPCGFNKNNRL